MKSSAAQRTILGAALVSVVGAFGMSAAADRAATGAAAHGRQVYIADGCPQCHGVVGEGSVGPRLAPSPLPLAAFTHQLRNPRGVMAVYTAKVLSEADLKDIYAYLSSIPQAKSVAQIPLLNP